MVRRARKEHRLAFSLAGFVLSALLVLGACATSPGTADAEGESGRTVDGARPESDAAADVVTVARSLVGRKRIAGSPYTLDCSGLVLHVHATAGVPLDDLFTRAAGNGVRRLYAIGVDGRVEAPADAIRPGDVLFWDNSYDRNENGEWDDPLTHTGIATDIDEAGTVTFVHHHYRDGVVTARMNVARPDDPQFNSPMRMRGQRVSGHPEYTAAQLLRGAASLYEVGGP